jgi:hypothetical protein
MLPPFYQNHLQNYLTSSEFLTCQILVWLLQFHKQIRIERLAACLPIPILFESRRRCLQRFLILKKFSITLLWFPLIESIIINQVKTGSRLIIALARTQWKANNVLMVSVIWHKRALPIYWQLLNKQGSSNLAEQIAVLRPVLKLFKKYELVIVGDREFRGVELAYWLKHKKVYFVFRQKHQTYIKQRGKNYQQLKNLNLSPGNKIFFSEINLTKKKGFGYFSLAAYWKRKYKSSQIKQAWYLITNLDCLDDALKIYQVRSGIEAMFKDCKTGGYNLEDSKANQQRLNSLLLLIAIAYTTACLKGNSIKKQGVQKYISRLKEHKRIQQRHSNFWVGLYGYSWCAAMEECFLWVRELMQINSNKLPFFVRGLRACFQTITTIKLRQLLSWRCS